MSVSLTVNGTTYAYPATGDSNWGAAATNWATAVTNGMLQKTGGLFALTADVNFGTNFGLKSLYLITASTNPAGTGVIRLANTDGIGFRNVGNTADFLLQPDADGLLQYNSIDLVNLSASQTLTNKSISGSTNTFSSIPISAITGSITNSLLSPMATLTLKGNNTGSSAVPSDLTVAQVTTMLGLSTPTGASLVLRDANANTQINNVAEGFSTTVTAASTTTLTVASSHTQQFTGTTTQTVVLPNATTLVLGQQFLILNRSTGVLTLNANGGTLVQILGSNSQTFVTVTNIATSAGTWDSAFSSSSSGTVTSVTFTGDGTVLSSTASTAVTTSGTVTAALKTQTAGTFLAGPTSGSAAAPTFRALQIPTKHVFTSSGTYTPSTGILYAKVTVIGAGGGAVNGATVSGGAGGGGGGGGGTAISILSATTIGSTQTVTVGTGVFETTGNTSSFGALLSATGGAPGAAGIGVNGPGAGGIGGIGSSGNMINFSGGDGVNGVIGVSGTADGPGGSGGSSFMGGGGYGGFNGGAGSDGHLYGGGAGGGAGASNTGQTGGNGVVIVEEFYQ